ncbi:MAG: T9SS type A sorting domain-containing protein [Crocinitomicaceae bacterium]|nr:T9SS type A sorting domain-containing protein [Crocinitomicaceae bacterium]
MKNFSLLLVFLSGVFTLFAQDTLNYEWIMRRSSPLPFGNSEGWSIGTDANENIYWGVNQDMSGFQILMDATVYKFDSDTNELWMEHAVSDIYSQQSYNLKVTDSLIYLAGRTCSTLGVGNCQALLFTTDVVTGATQQITLWTQGNGYEEIDGIHFEPDGIILTGWTRSATTAMDVLILKVDYQGNEIWRKVWGSGVPNRDEHQDGHIVVDDSMIYVSGLYEGTPGLGFQGKALLAKFDKTNGNFVDSVLYGRNDLWINAENALGMSTDGEFLYCTGVSTTAPNNWDLFLTKYDKDLNQIWYTTWGGSEGESARSVHVANDGNIYVVGNTESYGNDSLNIAFIKFNQNGVEQWYKTWGGNDSDQALDFHVYQDNFYITGKSQSTHPNGMWEAFLMKVNLNTLNANKLSEGNDYRIYPNPFSHQTTISFSNVNQNPVEFEIMDLAGNSVMKLKGITTDSIVVDRSDLSSGLYIFNIELNGISISGKLIIE